MQTRDIVGFVLVPLVILTAGFFAEIRGASTLWLEPSILWVLRLAAYSLLIVGGTGLLCQLTPGRIPIWTVFIVWLAINGLMLLKFLWEAYVVSDMRGQLMQFGPGRERALDAALLHIPDLIGFAVVLLGAFVISRAATGKKYAEPL